MEIVTDDKLGALWVLGGPSREEHMQKPPFASIIHINLFHKKLHLTQQ